MKVSSRRSSAAQQQQQQQRRRKSSSATKSSTKHSQQKQNLKEIMKRPSLQLTWKDRFLLCIGWTDPAKLEARLREQMKENEMEKGRRKIEEEEEREEEKEQQPLLLNGRRKTKGREKLETKQQSVVLEEVPLIYPFSVSSLNPQMSLLISIYPLTPQKSTVYHLVMKNPSKSPF